MYKCALLPLIAVFLFAAATVEAAPVPARPMVRPTKTRRIFAPLGKRCLIKKLAKLTSTKKTAGIKENLKSAAESLGFALLASPAAIPGVAPELRAFLVVGTAVAMTALHAPQMAYSDEALRSESLNFELASMKPNPQFYGCMHIG